MTASGNGWESLMTIYKKYMPGRQVDPADMGCLKELESMGRIRFYTRNGFQVAIGRLI